MSAQKRSTLFTRPINLYYMLVGSTFALSIFGLIMVFSASSIYSLDNKGATWAILFRQLTFLLLALPMAWALSRFSLAQWKFFARFGVSFSGIIGCCATAWSW